jgi:putative ABC transport system substrate-binding protein
VAVLANFANPSAQDQWEITARGARALGLEPTLAKVRDRGDLNAALSEVARDRPDALHVVSDALFDAARDEIVRFASLERLPAVYEHRAFTESGGLMSYGPNLDRVTTRAAWYIVKILQGTRPGELPVEAPTHFELVVNLRAAKAMGIQISPLVLSRADEVIE